MSHKTKAVRRIKEFPTLEALVRGIFTGVVRPEDAEAIIDAVGMGLGLSKRSRELAGAMEQGPGSVIEDPVYAKGLQDGFEAARRWQAEGKDIMAMEHVDPLIISRAYGVGMATTDPDAARALEVAAKAQRKIEPPPGFEIGQEMHSLDGGETWRDGAGPAPDPGAPAMKVVDVDREHGVITADATGEDGAP